MCPAISFIWPAIFLATVLANVCSFLREKRGRSRFWRWSAYMAAPAAARQEAAAEEEEEDQTYSTSDLFYSASAYLTSDLADGQTYLTGFVRPVLI